MIINTSKITTKTDDGDDNDDTSTIIKQTIIIIIGIYSDNNVHQKHKTLAKGSNNTSFNYCIYQSTCYVKVF